MSDVTTNKENGIRPKRKFSTRFIAGTAVLAAVAFVLQFIEVPLTFIMPSFIKFDFSDLPALLGTFAYGPVAGVLIELIKNLFHCLVTQSFGVGELSNFMLGVAFTLPAGIIYKFDKSKRGAVIGSVVGAIIMGAASLPFNYYIVYPVYYNFMPQETILAMYKVILPQVKSIFQCLLIFNVPFTVVKGLISTLITVFIYKPLSPILHGRRQ